MRFGEDAQFRARLLFAADVHFRSRILTHAHKSQADPSATGFQSPHPSCGLLLDGGRDCAAIDEI